MAHIMLSNKHNKDLNEFRKHCERYIRMLNLNNWAVAYELGEKGTEHNACCRYDVIGQKAVMVLSSDYERQVPIKSLAKHECLELLLADMATKMNSVYVNSIVDCECHRVINRLMNVID